MASRREDINGAGGQRALALDLGDQRWALQGGWTEAELLGLRIAIVDGDDVRQVSVRIPFTVDRDGDPIVGKPEVQEGWPE